MALGLAACTREPAQRSPAVADSAPASRRVAACSLVTSAEVASATGRPIGAVTAQDTLYGPAFWASTCSFHPARAPGDSAVVIVSLTGDYPTVADAAELADAVSAEAMGIVATPLEGFPLAAAVFSDTALVAQQGVVRLLISGAPLDAARSIASTAASRLP